MSFTWSYTSISCLETCPREFYKRYVLKEKTTSPALVHGNAVHRGCELFMQQGIVTEYIKEQIAKKSLYWDLVVDIRRLAYNQELFVEYKMGLNGIFEPVGFFDDNVWGRAAADVTIIKNKFALVPDWKTGKIREKATQLAVLALFLFKHRPDVDVVTGFNVWLEHGKQGVFYTFKREQEATLWAAILPKIEAAEKFMANPPESAPACQCGWCNRNEGGHYAAQKRKF